MAIYDTTRERTATLPDGSLLRYRRPGGNMLRTIERESVVALQNEVAERIGDLTEDARKRNDAAEIRRERSRPQRWREEEERLDALPREERRQAKRAEAFRSTDHARLVGRCAISWTLAGEPVADAEDLEALRDLPEEVLEDAARVIFYSHYDRDAETRGNSSTTSAS